ncbi:MAG: hypothetical protein J1F36_03420 [Clostridiales bacterium]|nr:hypothetical protein [Clostridiales bacterium]
MKTKTKLQVFTLGLAIMLSLLTLCAFGVNQVAAEELAESEIETVSAYQEMPLGIYTSLSLNINGDGQQVWATVKNDVSIFISTVKVYVYLYSSPIYQESYRDMTMESSNYIADLDMGKTLTTYAPINGVKRYWQARIYYKVDSNDWKEKVTSVVLVDVDGTGTIV